MTIEEAGAALRTKQVSSVELTTECLKQAERYDNQINAFVTMTRQSALTEAARRDKELRDGTDRGPLHGIPIALKDLFDTAGVRTTYGSKIFADHIPGEDADVVRDLKEGGAVFLGKLGLHEFAYGITSTNPHFGPVRNPWNLAYVPGGSSGGSAAAVVTRMAFMALGTDTGGSIRIPAAFCGVCGLKPTYGLLSTGGCRPLSESLDHMGPLARTVRDLASSMAALTKRPWELPSGGSLKGLKVGFPTNFFFDHALPPVAAGVRKVASTIEAAGGEVVDVSVDAAEDLVELALAIILPEASDTIVDLWPKRADFGEDVRARFEQGFAQDPKIYLRAQRGRVAAARRFLKVFEQCDVLLTPASPTPAPRIGDNILKLNGTDTDLRLAVTRLVRPINVLGNPTLSMPSGLSGGLPIGVQFIGRHGEDAALLRLGAAIEDRMAPIIPPWDGLVGN